MLCRGSSLSLDKHGINKSGPVTLDELIQKAGALYMQGKIGPGGATDNQQALEPEAGIHSLAETPLGLVTNVEAGRLLDLVAKPEGGDTETSEKAEGASRKRLRRDDNETD
jgi:hypothetical protein